MMVADKHFRLKRSFKVSIALMKGSKEDRDHFKRMMIDAQLCEEAAKRAALKSKEQKGSYGPKEPATAE
jgi:hypothetical protein